MSSLLKRHPFLIARGNGRAYGDAAMNRDATVAMYRFARILAFDIAAGLIVCEAGVLLSDVMAASLPHGWFPSVVPGTRHVSVGGMLAADIHGKNHPHAGSFAKHVAWLELMTADGAVVRCSPAQDRELFEATLGGMGLTGIILRAALVLRKIEGPLIRERTVRCQDLHTTIDAFEANRDSPYAMAWVDFASRRRPGRSVLRFGEHASADLTAAVGSRPARQQRFRVPAGTPPLPFTRAAISLGNTLLFSGARIGERLVPLDRFFFPLDAIGDWNRLYGKRGLIQFQCALPADAAAVGMDAILAGTRATDATPTLAVLKRLGPGRGMLSFPIPGYTLALDLAARPETIALVERMEDIVGDLGGRVYLAKDAVSTPGRIAKAYSGLPDFLAVRARVDPERRFSSLLSRRLGL